MPQVDIHYSNHLDLDCKAISDAIDAAINQVDGPDSGCRIRTMPATFSNIDHLLISIGLLEKPHRDKTFRENMVETLYKHLEDLLPTGIPVSINLYWLSDTYATRAMVSSEESMKTRRVDANFL